MQMLKEFKKFIMRGNVIDLAVAVVIGAAFGAVIKSLVDDIIMPPIGMLLGGVNFSDLFIALDGQQYASLAAAQAAGAPTINYGVFINTIIIFIIVAFVVFLIVKAIERARKKEEPAPAAPSTKKCPECLSDIPLEAKRCAFCTTKLE
jgi:large conductance mechanosensitive channel